jgi:hypothetical protein
MPDAPSDDPRIVALEARVEELQRALTARAAGTRKQVLRDEHGLIESIVEVPIVEVPLHDA